MQGDCHASSKTRFQGASKRLAPAFRRFAAVFSRRAELGETELDPDSEASVVKELEDYLGGSSQEEEFSFDAVTLDFGAEPVEIAVPEAENASSRVFKIEFQPTRALYENGHEPLLIFDALAELGDLHVEADLSQLPAFDSTTA